MTGTRPGFKTLEAETDRQPEIPVDSGSGKSDGPTDCPLCMHVIDFEKRALHILIFLDSASKLRAPEDIDRIVSAEINDPYMLPESHDTLFHVCFMDLAAFSTSTRHHPFISHGKYTKR